METFENSKELYRKSQRRVAMREFKIFTVALAAACYCFFINDGFSFGDYWFWAFTASMIVAAIVVGAAKMYFD
jgi:fatty acid desaturase